MSIPKFLRIIRVHIVAGGFLAFSLGTLLALVGGGSFDFVRYGLGYAAVFLGDLSTHYSNDYFDVEVDKYVKQRKFFAGKNILVDNPSLRLPSKLFSLVLLGCSNILAVVFVVFLGAPFEFFIVMLCASLVGWFYSAPPVRLVSRGFGELAVAIVTGFAIPGLGYLAIRGQFDPMFFYFAFPFVMYGLILSLSLHAPDAEVDRRGEKLNLAVRLGQRRVFFLILTLAFSATLTFCLYAWQGVLSIVNSYVIVLLSIVPLVAGLVGLVIFLEKKEVNSPSALNVAALFVFNILLNSYLLFVASVG